MTSHVRTFDGPTPLKQRLTKAEFFQYLDGLAHSYLHDMQPGRAAETGFRRASDVALSEVVFSILEGCLKVEETLNVNFKNAEKFMNDLGTRMAAVESSLASLRAYSEATRRLPGFAQSLNLQNELDTLRRTDKQQAKALNEVRDELELIKNELDDEDDPQSLTYRVGSLEARLTEAEEDLKQVCDEVFEGEDEDGAESLLSRVVALENATFEGEDEEADDTETHYHGTDSLVSTAAWRHGHGVVRWVETSGTLTDSPGRPKVGTVVSWDVARRDMLAHPEARYAPTSGEGMLYRIKLPRIECKAAPGTVGSLLAYANWQDSHFNKGGTADSLKWVRQSDEPGVSVVVVPKRPVVVVPKRPEVGSIVKDEVALEDMKRYPAARYADKAVGSLVYRVRGGQLEVILSNSPNDHFTSSDRGLMPGGEMKRLPDVA